MRYASRTPARAGGNTCYADTPEGMNREHALFDADRCVAVTPSDTAPVLVVLEAEMLLRSAGGERSVRAEDFFIGPSMIRGWITGAEYAEQHDPARWQIAPCEHAGRRAEAGNEGGAD